jgi:hypothetical protein
MMLPVGDQGDPRRIEELKRLVNDESYLADAIRRIAQVISDDLLTLKVPGASHERKR